jgi:hypothetical protein
MGKTWKDSKYYTEEAPPKCKEVKKTLRYTDIDEDYEEVDEWPGRSKRRRSSAG